MRRADTLALLAIAAAAAATLALNACGNDDGSSEDEDRVTEVIETSTSSTDPADCTRLATQRYLEQSNRATGEDAINECEEKVTSTEDDPDSIDISNVEVDGSSASADVTYTGSVLDGSTATVSLVKEGDQWKLDYIEDIPDLDAESFRGAFREQLESDQAPEQIIDCIDQALADASEDEITTALLSGSEEELIAIFGECVNE